MADRLHEYLTASTRRAPERPAVEDPGVATINYGELDRLSGRVRDRLRRMGVREGDRVGLALRKSIDSVAAIFGVQKCGAAHVPVDVGGPIERSALIFEDCAVRTVVAEARLAETLRAGMRGREVAVLPLDFEAGALPISRALDALDANDPVPTGQDAPRGPGELAYILYTSGSTGKPKGVMISQRSATVFVDWCSEVCAPREDDRFSSHAPFHFDLSVLDIYLPLKHGATVVLISEANGKDPVTLAGLVADQRITCWYSTPSILSFLTQFGRLERHDWSALRLVNFAGEVFAVKHLRALKERVPHPRYLNLYGPTETNVCTFYEIPREIPAERAEPFPIGRPCPHYRHRVVDREGIDVARGEEGELWVSGPGVMMGYWNAPERDAEVFRTDAKGQRWYRTGDIVLEPPDGNLIFLGRRDRMVKKRGYRIELGEIETALYRHPDVKEAAVVALRNGETGVRIRAFLSFRDRKPTIIQLNQFCAAHLVDYMIPDQFALLEALPKTSTDKTDYQALKELP
jgi:amino acid adenylation domain-containing protein